MKLIDVDRVVISRIELDLLITCNLDSSRTWKLKNFLMSPISGVYTAYFFHHTIFKNFLSYWSLKYNSTFHLNNLKLKYVVFEIFTMGVSSWVNSLTRSMPSRKSISQFIHFFFMFFLWVITWNIFWSWLVLKITNV